MKLSKNKGVSIIEIIVVTSLITISVLGIIIALNVFLNLSLKNSNKAQAALLIEETLEIIMYLRDDSWTDNIEPLINSTDYYLIWNGNFYSATTTPQIDSGKFSRTFSIEDVNRDVNGNIISSGGSEDPDTEKVSVSVYWSDNLETEQVDSEFLIHNIYDN